MVKDIVLASSEEEMKTAKPIWTLPAKAYTRLMWTVMHKSKRYPILSSITAHSEGAEGNFSIPPERIPILVKEIDELLTNSEVRAFEDLTGILTRLRDIAVRARETNKTIYGFAD